MSLKGLPEDRRVFIERLASGNDAQLILCPGISLRRLKAGGQVGIALQISREVLRAGQMQQVLERRFEQALAFDGCFIYLDAEGALVIWQALSQSGDTGDINEKASRLLSLASLEALDASYGY